MKAQTLAVALLAALAPPARAQDAGVDPDTVISVAKPPPPPPDSDGVVLVAAGSSWQASIATTRRTTRALAGVVLGGLDVADDKRKAVPSITGDDALGAQPEAWPLANRPDAVTVALPLAMGPAADCRCTTTLDAVAPIQEDERVAVLWATTRFDVTASDLRVLDLGVRYGDGVVVWINGVEVARRRIVQAARPMALAEMVRGPEWETFHVPVVPGLLRDGDNVIAVAVRPSGRSSGPRLDVQLVGRAAPTLVRGPLLQEVTQTSAKILIETDLAAEAEVEWGATDALGQRVASTAGAARRHVVALTELPAMVWYRVIVDGAATPVQSFRTMPADGHPVRIAVYGDVRGGHDIHAGLVKRMRGEDPDLVLATGDLVLRGSDEGDWQRFFSVTREMMATIPFWSAPGNHDTGRAGDARRRFADVFVLPPLVDGADERPAWASWSSFDAGDVHVTLLDSNAYDEPGQLDWLEQDLTAARERGARVLIAATHDGPFSRGEHGGNKVAAKRYVPVLVRHKTSLILSGHDHIYQRGRTAKLDYIVSGGGGASLYDISCTNPKKKCRIKDGMLAVAKEHHFVLLTVYPDFIEACPQRADGSALEPCAKITVPAP